jgi:hypothetical protein
MLKVPYVTRVNDIEAAVTHYDCFPSNLGGADALAGVLDGHDLALRA